MPSIFFVADGSPLNYEPKFLVLHEGCEGKGCDSALFATYGNLRPVGMLHEFSSARATVVCSYIEVLAMFFDIFQNA